MLFFETQCSSQCNETLLVMTVKPGKKLLTCMKRSKGTTYNEFEVCVEVRLGVIRQQRVLQLKTQHSTV